MYRIWFTFRNSYGQRTRAFLDNNGKGFPPMDAFYVARELKRQGKTRVKIARVGSPQDERERADYFK